VTKIASDDTVSMPRPPETEPDLAINTEYVSAIEAAKPVAYWRFEQAEDKTLVRNEVSSRWPLRLCGDAHLVGTPGNMRAEFLLGPRESWLKTDDVVTAFRADYSVEFWFNSVEYRQAATISLHPPHRDTRVVTGQLDLVGADHLTLMPGSLRFVHRDPPGIAGGRVAVSSRRYTPRKWHYVVATADASQLQLFMDGELVGDEPNQTRLTVDPYVVIGRLTADTSPAPGVDSRPFVGQLDEFAIYSRVLRPDEIRAHFNLAASKNSHNERGSSN
jgi:hypothetical protein